MKAYFLKKLATWFADNNVNIIHLIQSAILAAETKFPTMPDKSHQAKRWAWVKDRAAQYLTGKAGWIVDTIVQMMLAYLRLKGGKA